MSLTHPDDLRAEAARSIAHAEQLQEIAKDLGQRAAALNALADRNEALLGIKQDRSPEQQAADVESRRYSLGVSSERYEALRDIAVDYLGRIYDEFSGETPSRDELRAEVDAEAQKLEVRR